MAETKESLIEKIRVKEMELQELEMKCHDYWSMVSLTNDAYAHTEAKKLSRRINSRRNTIMKMKDKLASI